MANGTNCAANGKGAKGVFDAFCFWSGFFAHFFIILWRDGHFLTSFFSLGVIVRFFGKNIPDKIFKVVFFF